MTYKKIWAVCLTVISLGMTEGLPPAHAQSLAEGLTVYRGATLIDGKGNPARPDVAIYVRGERIEKITSAAAHLPDGAKLVDVSGMYVVPGLINSHVHLATPPNRPWAQAMLRREVYSGVTAERNMADDVRQIADLARSARVGEIPGPDIYYAALMAGPEFFSDPRVTAVTRGAVAGAAPWMKAITPDTDLKIAVAQAHGTGATGLKIYASLNADEVAAITKEAHAQGMQVWAHAAVFPAGPQEVIDAGVDDVSHACMLAEEPATSYADAHHHTIPEARYADDLGPRMRAMFDAMKRRGTVFDPTLRAYVAYAELAAKAGKPPHCSLGLAARIAAAAYRAGVTIDAGTDSWSADGNPWSPLQDELELLQDSAGMSPADVLRAATQVGATVIRQQQDMGTVESGKLANLVFVTGNPLDNVKALRTVVLTVKRGTEFWRKDFTPIQPSETRGPHMVP